MNKLPLYLGGKIIAGIYDLIVFYKSISVSFNLGNTKGIAKLSWRESNIFIDACFRFKLSLPLKYFNPVVCLQQNAVIIEIKERSKILCIGCLQLH